MFNKQINRYFFHSFLLCLLLITHADAFSQQQPDWQRFRDSGILPAVDTTLSGNGQVLAKLERMSLVISRVFSSIEQKFDTKGMEAELPEITEEIKIIRSSLGDANTLNLRNLQLFQISLQDIFNDLRDWRTSLADYNRQMIVMHNNVSIVGKDTAVINQSDDSASRVIYSGKLVLLKQKLFSADSICDAGLIRIDSLQNKLSDIFTAALEVRRNVRKQFNKFSVQAFSKEYPYLWETPADTKKPRSKNSFKAERTILNYYLSNSNDDRYRMLALGLLFFIWVFINYRNIKKRNVVLNTEEFKVHFLRHVPFFSSCVVMLALSPFFDLHPPAIYADILQFLLLVALTFLLGHTWPRKLFYCWLGFALLFLLLSFTNLIFYSVTAQRWWHILINVLSITMGIIFYPRVGKTWTLGWLIRLVVFIFLLLNAAAIVANISGRVTLSEIFTGAAIFGVTQVIGLAVFVRIIVEAIYLQLVLLRIKGGAGARFHFETISKKVANVLSLLSLLLWLMVFTINLNLYDNIYNSVTHFFSDRRNIGSNSFSYGNIALFFVIIYIAHIIQKYIAFIWDNGSESIIPVKKGRIGSRLLFMRLILLTLGFLLAVAASGLPLDKITIILSALGVGIGFGLQNIVNNVVSGIILIFERPLEIGDSIEIRDKKGMVKEIGLRSTKLASEDGAEIIIPNGDFISEHVVNWTLSHNYVRLEVIVYVPSQSDLVVVNKIVLETIAANEKLYHELPPAILIENINNKRLKLRVQFWYTDKRQQDEMKSEVLTDIRSAFQKAGIEII